MPDHRHSFTDAGCRAPGEGVSGAMPALDWGGTIPAPPALTPHRKSEPSLEPDRACGERAVGAKEEFRRVVKVLLADDHKVVRAGLKAVLESNDRVDVVGEASSGEEAVERVRALEPDIVIMELGVPGMDGIRAIRAITALGPATRVLVFTVHDDDEYLEAALDAGAAGFLSKSATDRDITGAVQALVRGHSYLPRRATFLLARRKTPNASCDTPGPGVLSPRELAVVTLYARGFTASEMGRQVFLSPKTVEGYLARARNKLGLTRRPELVRFALEAGLMGRE